MLDQCSCADGFAADIITPSNRAAAMTSAARRRRGRVTHRWMMRRHSPSHFPVTDLSIWWYCCRTAVKLSSGESWGHSHWEHEVLSALLVYRFKNEKHLNCSQTKQHFNASKTKCQVNVSEVIFWISDEQIVSNVPIHRPMTSSSFLRLSGSFSPKKFHCTNMFVWVRVRFNFQNINNTKV